jgi:hypothetical protein
VSSTRSRISSGEAGFTIRHVFNVSAEQLFAFINDAANFVSFTGFGPVPGVVQATCVEEARRDLRNVEKAINCDGLDKSGHRVRVQ